MGEVRGVSARRSDGSLQTLNGRGRNCGIRRRITRWRRAAARRTLITSRCRRSVLSTGAASLDGGRTGGDAGIAAPGGGFACAGAASNTRPLPAVRRRSAPMAATHFDLFQGTHRRLLLQPARRSTMTGSAWFSDIRLVRQPAQPATIIGSVGCATLSPARHHYLRIRGRRRRGMPICPACDNHADALTSVVQPATRWSRCSRRSPLMGRRDDHAISPGC